MNNEQIGVYAAICAVQKDLSSTGITKDSKNQAQGYSFRGIDAVYNALSPLLSNHGLCILPRVLSRECVERQTAKGGAIFYVTVEVEFDFVCAKDGSKHTVKTFGEAMDSADKATNKAMSAAYKYAAFQAFSIPTEGDNDADSHTPVVSSRYVSAPAEEFAKLPANKQAEAIAAAEEVELLMADDKIIEASKIVSDAKKESAEFGIGVWSQLDSSTRSAIVKHTKSLESNK